MLQYNGTADRGQSSASDTPLSIATPDDHGAIRMTSGGSTCQRSVKNCATVVVGSTTGQLHDWPLRYIIHVPSAAHVAITAPSITPTISRCITTPSTPAAIAPTTATPAPLTFHPYNCGARIPSTAPTLVHVNATMPRLNRAPHAHSTAPPQASPSSTYTTVCPAARLTTGSNTN